MDSAGAKKLWDRASRHLRDTLHPDVFQRWISVIDSVGLDGSSLVLGVDNDFYQTWLEEHYLPLIENAVQAAGGESLKIVFQLKQAELRPQQEESPPRPSLRERLTQRSRSRPVLNEKFTFDAFVVGSCNSFAHAASLAVAQAPARAYNPLFIYGGVGLGKTHLMQAIGQYVIGKSRATVAYLSSESFTNEYIHALQTRSLVQFRKKYRHVDVLLIDDIHFLAGKERLQEEFFHTFNTLFDAHKQLVLTSDRPASEILGLEQRLVSRFEWGLVTELEPPDLETRIAILRQKLAQTQMALADDVLLFLAENVRSNIRRLEGALIRVISYASLTGQQLGMPALRHLLRDTLHEEQAGSVSLSSIQKAVADYYDVRPADLAGKRRQHAIAAPRQVAMYLCRQMTDASLSEIGTAFAKTHATILYACKTVERRMDLDASLRRNLHAIARQLGTNLQGNGRTSC